MKRSIVMAAPLLGVLLLGTGCSEAMTLTGNGLSMVVTCVLLWSTINLNRPDGDEESGR